VEPALGYLSPVPRLFFLFFARMIGCAEYANYALAIRALSPIEEHDAADTSTRYGIAVISFTLQVIGVMSGRSGCGQRRPKSAGAR
jgi:hypothetical protein